MCPQKPLKLQVSLDHSAFFTQWQRHVVLPYTYMYTLTCACLLSSKWLYNLCDTINIRYMYMYVRVCTLCMYVYMYNYVYVQL